MKAAELSQYIQNGEQDNQDEKCQEEIPDRMMTLLSAFLLSASLLPVFLLPTLLPPLRSSFPRLPSGVSCAHISFLLGTASYRSSAGRGFSLFSAFRSIVAFPVVAFPVSGPLSLRTAVFFIPVSRISAGSIRSCIVTGRCSTVRPMPRRKHAGLPQRFSYNIRLSWHIGRMHFHFRCRDFFRFFVVK